VGQHIGEGPGAPECGRVALVAPVCFGEESGALQTPGLGPFHDADRIAAERVERLA
jgi:hypothetical protein